MKRALYLLVLLTFVWFNSYEVRATFFEDLQSNQDRVSNRSSSEKQIETHLGGLPVHILEDILQYEPNPRFRKVNKQFYTLITGEIPGQASTGMKESSKLHKMNNSYQISYLFPINTLIFNISSKKTKYRPVLTDSIPTWIWHRLLGQVFDIPINQMLHLRGTNIHTLNHFNLTSENILDFSKGLQGTNIQTIRIYNCSSIAKNISNFAKALKETHIHALYLNCNEIAEHALAFAQALEGTQVNIVHLKDNHISQEMQQAILDLKLPIKFIF